MTAQMESGARPPGDAVETAPWVHLSRHGTEIGGEVPSGTPRGPVAAFTAAVKLAWEVRETLWVLVVRDFKSRYRAQSLGLFWSFAHPLVMMVSVTIAFRYILHVGIENFQVFYLVGAVFWQFFSNSVIATTGSMLDNAGLVKRTTFPRFLFPIATMLSHLILLSMELVLVFGFFFVFPEAYTFTSSLLAIPLLLLILMLMIVGVGFTTCGLNVRYRDIHYLTTSFITVFFWITPVLFRVDMVPPWLQPAMLVNPVGIVIESVRNIIMFGRWPNMTHVSLAGLSAVLVFFFGCAVFRRENLRIADYV
ncbi:MAG TPA: ABC transporter permease [Polyangiaceae bacterium]|nr:ABC transporter permease [Polyangiaceae bacterium]